MMCPGSEQPGERRSSAQTVAWPNAPEVIRRLAGSVAGRPVMVGISGPVASGKSTLARLVSPCIVATDDYLPDYDKVAYHERDDPRNADFPRLAADLASLRRGMRTAVPRWSFHSHSREGEREVDAGPMVVCEGIHALHAMVARLYDVAVYVDAPRDIRLARMEARERSGVRGWGVEAAREFFHAVAEPTFERFAAEYRARAHVIVVNEGQSPA